MTEDQSTHARYILGYALVAAMLCGGGTVRGLWIDAFLQIGLICASTYVIIRFPNQSASSAGISMFCLVLFVGLVQLIPLPVAIFGEIRQHIFLPQINDTVVSSTTISLASSRTISSLMTALCPIYFFVALSKLQQSDLMCLVRFFLLAVALNLVVLLLSYSSDQAVDFSSFLGFDVGVGLFANDNHLSSLLCASIPLFIYAGMFMGWGYVSNFAVLAILVLLLAIGSRAGILIGIATLSSSLVLLFWKACIGRFAGLALLAIVTVYGYGAFVRIGAEVEETTLSRRDFTLTTVRAIEENWLTGTGFGSFDMVYPHYQRPQDVYSVFVNHAHNDFLEVFLEGGLAVAAIIICYLWLLFARLFALELSPLQRLSFLSVCVVLIHSTVDYPLRTTAISIAFAFFNALLFSPRNRPLMSPSNGRSVAFGL
ncbi:O-antigen polymerase [Agrobacterium tumefaciens F2]|jgi:O-antigen ligase|nr:O-antigen polymerase [Agrobacterium tumefaciens F2]